MDIPNSHAEARAAITTYLMSGAAAALPEAARKDMIRASQEASWVTGYDITVESLWAVRDRLDAAGKTLLGALAGFMAAPGNDFMEKGRSGRGVAMQRAMQRELGEPAPPGMPWPEPGEDPETAPGYAPAAQQQIPGDPDLG